MLGFRLSKQLKNKKIKLWFKEDIEPQEVFLDLLAEKKEKELGFSERKAETPLSKKIIQGAQIALLILALVFFGKTLYLQLIQGENLAALAEQNKLRLYPIMADRGVIYDRFGNQLVLNKPSFDLVVDTRGLPSSKDKRIEIIKEVSQIINKNFEQLKEKINNSDIPTVLILENIDHQTLIQLKTSPLFSFRGGGTGFRIEENTVRDYLDGSKFAHLIGFTRRISREELKKREGYLITDYIGKAGIEKRYQEILRGKTGFLQIERDALGRQRSKKIFSEPEPGESLVLWTDAELQKKLLKSLSESIERVGARSGAAIALDPRSGGVLALVSFPSFDNNLFSQGMSVEQWESLYNNPDNPLFNRAISGIGLPAGSTIKPLIGLAALEEEIITGETIIYSPLEICLPNPWFPGEKDCFADWRYHGYSGVRRAIAESVNTFFYIIGGGYRDFRGLGPQRIVGWLEKFGLGAKTGIDLPGEGRGILPDIGAGWSIGNTYHLSIGQGYFTVTPLQITAAFMAIANEGVIYRPQVVKKIIDVEKNIIEKIVPEVLKTVPVKQENLEIIRQGMRQKATSPDSPVHQFLNFLPVGVAAKTGTAQTGEENIYHNWITIFAPYDNPEIVLTIMIENIVGMQAAVSPVARDVLTYYFGELRQNRFEN